jgi:hypothetical protein
MLHKTVAIQNRSYTKAVCCSKKGEIIMKKTLIIFICFFFVKFSYAQTNDEIVKDFTEKVKSVITKLDAKDAVNFPPDTSFKEWYRRKASILTIDMDVLKTNSLMNPIVGELNFLCVVSGTKALTLEDLNKKNDDFNSSSNCRSSFSFISSQWRLTKLQCERRDLDTKITSYVNVSEKNSNWLLKQCNSAFKEVF